MNFWDSYVVFEIIRPLFLWGLRVRLMIDGLDPHPGDLILDAGCGYGRLAPRFRACDYTGIDSNETRIRQAKQRLGETSSRRFVALDIRRTGYPAKHFDRTIANGLLHHLSDPQARECLTELARITKKRIVFCDPVYSKGHLINNLLCVLDRGHFVRKPEGYAGLCRGILKLEKQAFFYSRNFLAKYHLAICAP